jgi:hypothetical protein
VFGRSLASGVRPVVRRGAQLQRCPTLKAREVMGHRAGHVSAFSEHAQQLATASSPFISVELSSTHRYHR